MKYFLLLFTLLAGSTLEAQTPFEGRVVTEVKALEVPESARGKESMFGQSITTYTKDERVRVEQRSAAGTTVIITDEEKKEVIMLMDIMGQKIAMVMPLEEGGAAPSSKEAVADIVLTEERKSIAGHPCRKALVTYSTDGKNETMEIWYAEDLDNTSGEYKEVPGMPMEYTVRAEGMTLLFQVVEVSDEKVSDTQFAIPAGYRTTTQADMEQLFPYMEGSGED